MLAGFLGKIKAQYWFWFVREKLILQEINDISNRMDKMALQRRKELGQLIEHPLTVGGYSHRAMSDRLFKLNGGKDFGYELSGYVGHFKRGLRTVPNSLKNRIDRLIPGSKKAHDHGPYNLFRVLEANSLPEAVWTINSTLLEALESDGDDLNPDFQEMQTILIENTMSSIFSGIYKMLESQTRAFNILFPENDWERCTAYLKSPSVSSQELDVGKLNQSNILPFYIAAPIAISFAFVRAKFFGEVHFLARLCFGDEFLKFLNLKYMMKEELWFCSCAGSMCADEFQIRQVFQSAKFRSTPLLFSDPQRIPNPEIKQLSLAI